MNGHEICVCCVDGGNFRNARLGKHFQNSRVRVFCRPGFPSQILNSIYLKVYAAYEEVGGKGNCTCDKDITHL